MKRKIINLAVFFVFLLIVVSCYYDNEEALYPELSTVCDTTNVTFSGTIVTILNNNCFSCHSNNTAASFGNNIRLENYSDVVANFDRVLGSVKHNTGYIAMPKNGGTIKSCDISQLDIWKRDGFANN